MYELFWDLLHVLETGLEVKISFHFPEWLISKNKWAIAKHIPQVLAIL